MGHNVFKCILLRHMFTFLLYFVCFDSPDKTCRQTPQQPANSLEALCLYHQTSVSGGPLLFLNYEGREQRNSDRVQEPIRETGRGLGRRWKRRQRHEVYQEEGNREDAWSCDASRERLAGRIDSSETQRGEGGNSMERKERQTNQLEKIHKVTISANGHGHGNTFPSPDYSNDQFGAL